MNVFSKTCKGWFAPHENWRRVGSRYEIKNKINKMCENEKNMTNSNIIYYEVTSDKSVSNQSFERQYLCI